MMMVGSLGRGIGGLMIAEVGDRGFCGSVGMMDAGVV